MSLNVATCSAGQSPAPMATLQVYNPNAVAVAVTGIQLQFFDSSTNLPINLAANPAMPAMGPGQTVVAPALSSITFGPFPVAVGSAANANTFPAPSVGYLNPRNPQQAQSPVFGILVGALVYGSDGSTNDAGRAGLTVAASIQPPPTFQGGALQFAGPNNLVTGLLMGVV